MFSLIKSGMATAMHELAVISNNIANANSTGFKKKSVAFSDLGNKFNPEKVDSTKIGQGAYIVSGKIVNKGISEIFNLPYKSL